jgi:hypothetical protein
VRRRGLALEVLFSAFASNGIWKMNPTCAHGSESGTAVHCGEIKIKGISAWDGETKESSRT